MRTSLWHTVLALFRVPAIAWHLGRAGVLGHVGKITLLPNWMQRCCVFLDRMVRSGTATKDAGGALTDALLRLGPKSQQRIGERTACILGCCAGSHHPVEKHTTTLHPVRKQGDFANMSQHASSAEMPGNSRHSEQGQNCMPERSSHQSSFQPEWMQAMPAERLRTLIWAKPALANISARTSGVGKVRIDSAR